MSYINPRAKLYEHLDRLQTLKAGNMPSPVNLEIDLSNRCNLGCEWCHFAYTHTRGPLAGKQDKPDNAIPGGDMMGSEMIDRIVEQAWLCGVRSITWTGGGEPTLHPQFEKALMGAYSRGISQGVYTNGTMIDVSKANIIKGFCSWVYVSMDEPTRSSYERTKGPGFEKACNGTRLLVATPGKATVGVGFMIHQRNYMQVEKMISLGEDLQADYIQFRPTVLYANDDPGKRADDSAWVYDAIDYLAPYAKHPKVELDLDRFKMYAEWEGHGYPACYWSALQVVITPNGKVWTCVNKREYPGEEIGDLSAESLADILRRRTLPHVNGNCRVLCRGHIPNLALHEIMAEKPHSNFI